MWIPLLLALILLAVMQEIIFNQNRRIMVDQGKIDASLQRLTKAVDAVVVQSANVTADSTVNSVLANEDAQSARLEALIPPTV